MSDNGGVKFDQEKLRWELVPYDAVEEVVKVLTFGAKKYAPRNWERGMDWSRVYAALIRHMTSWFHGQDTDPETGISHLAHAGCCLMFLIAYEKRGTGNDDRPKLDQLKSILETLEKVDPNRKA